MKKAIPLLILVMGLGAAPLLLAAPWDPPRPFPFPPPPPPPLPLPSPLPAPAPSPEPIPEPPRAVPAEPAPQAAPADQSDSRVTFRMKSDYAHTVRLRFFSQRRSGWSWPGGDGYYVLKDYDFHDFRLNCMSGEKICYGAWAIDGTNTYWGSGAHDNSSCTNCCAVCGDGESVHTLEQ